MPLFNGSLNMTKVHKYGTELYPKLGALTGHQVSWHGCGGLRLATTDEEVLWLKHVYGISKLAGYEGHLIGPSEIPNYHPFLDTFGIKAAFLTVNDGHVAPADITLAMAAGARQRGAEIHRRTRVTDIKRLPSGEWQVITDGGNIVCEHVVNSAGSYCDVVASWTGHLAPISNLLHQYVITEPLQELIELDRELPVVRDPYSHSYLREEGNGVLVGPYETATAHTCWNDRPPDWDFESELLAPELDRVMPWLERATERMPLFGRAGIKSIIPGAITHTPDGVYLSGRPRARATTWMHCGASIGICQAAAPASIWRSGWCMGRPRSACANSILAASVIGQRPNLPGRSPSKTITTCTTAINRRSSTPSAANCARVRCTMPSRRGGLNSARSMDGKDLDTMQVPKAS